MNGNRNKITYPSGLVLQYAYDFADRPSSLTSGGASIVSAATYLPLGPLTSLTFGNGTGRTIQYDNRYRPLENKVTGPSGTIADYTYATDNVGNITQIHDATDPTYNRDFAYDDLNRLTTANTGSSLWGNGAYAYDAMGNISSSALGSWKTTTATFLGTTPKLSSVLDTGVARPVTYDAAGNETGVGISAFTYSPRNELVAADAATYTYDGRGVLTINTAPPTTLTLPVSIKGGSTGTGTVTLGMPAGLDTPVALVSDNPAATVPPSLTIPAGQTSATFLISTTGVAADVQVSITATVNGGPISATFSVLAPALSTFSVSPTSARGGDQITATVTLDSPAVGPTTVSIGGNLVNVPVSGSIAPGATSTNITATLARLGYGTPSQETLIAFLGTTWDGQHGLYATITELLPAISSFSVSPSTVVGGEFATAQGTVTGTSDFLPAYGMWISITSSNPALAGVPIGIQLTTNVSGSATVLTAPVSSSSPVVLTGSSGGVDLSASLTLQPVPVTISSLTVSPTSLVGGGNSATATITLTAAAPTGGIDVEVSTNCACATPAPPFVHIAAGATSTTFAINTTAVAATTDVTVSATHSATTKTTSLTVSVPSGNYITSLSANGTTVANGIAVQGGTLVSANLWLSVVASSNARVSLSSSNPSFASVPNSATVSKGSQNTGFTITTSSVASPASATVSATYGGVTQRLVITALPANAVTVVGITGIPSSLGGGYSGYGTITLTGVAPAGGAAITLGGTRTNIFTVPASVTIPAGGTSAYFVYSSPQFLGSVHATDVTATCMGITQSFRVSIQPITLLQTVPDQPVASAALSPRRSESAEPGRIVATAAGNPGKYYLYTPELQLMAETEGSTSDPKPIAYSYLWFGNVPVAQIDSANTIRWYATDHLGTPLLQTDTTGAIVWRAEYAPYGSVFSLRNGGSLHQPLRLPGQLAQDAGDLSYNVFRWYRSSWGRYTQTDPIASPLYFNPFAYVDDGPIAFRDPLGLYHVGEDDARDQPNATVMCDGRGHPVPYVSPYWRSTGEYRCFGECVLMHEYSHINDINRDAEGVCVGAAAYRVVIPNAFERDSSERRAWRIYQRCVSHFLTTANCTCRQLARREVDRAERVLRDRNW